MTGAARPPLAALLDLQPHPEGGWYRQTWVSPETVTLPDGRTRATATLIHFLLPAGDSSAWHRVASDEVWIAHTGSVALELGGDGAQPSSPAQVQSVVVGVDLVGGEVAQAVVPARVWQRTQPSGGDALVSCLVSPGFDFADFELVGDTDRA
ncbi:cupin domain-containing protein [Terrabacter sp. MAHUQ-38]|uniref:cupin domain-containing protein n=1 Tax=unclassified Terrabacter TaxID=2630222 RepID=UPI00165DEB20|nr:cupin domain-containing protein [Terrabacter sp. MAHUQ-38]